MTFPRLWAVASELSGWGPTNGGQERGLRPKEGKIEADGGDFGNIETRALVKLVTSWVKVLPVELDGSRSKRGIRDEAARPNHKRDIEWNCRVVTKVNLI